MRKIYQNFDGLELSFQCAIPEHILNMLKYAQENAKISSKNTEISLSENQIFEVLPKGLKGFTYCLDTGAAGETWGISHSNNSELWNIRVIVKSLALASHGYYKIKKKIQNFLINELNAIPPNNQKTPLERINYFNFAVDFMSPKNEFWPDVNCIKSPNKCKREYQGNISNISIFDLVLQNSEKRTPLISIGKMPNRKIIIYNKRAEITENKKPYWLDIWDINNNSDIWRVEIHAGKKELNKYGIRRFSDFENGAGDILNNILNDYRYINLDNKNLASFWRECMDSASLLPQVLEGDFK